MFGRLLQPVKPLLFILCLLSIAGCASAPVLQPQVNSLVVAQRFDYALRVLEEHKESYGPNNRLLYLLDYGMVLHLSSNYAQSVKKFESAKDLYDSLYTVSVRDEFKTWLVNDYYAPYRGEDFERVMINIFQALNFVMMGDIDGALVEARDVDIILKMINRQYKEDQKNTYQEDAFARFLMGILYEHKGTFEGYNNAFISYTKAVEAYENNYVPDYGMDIPQILKENILAAAQFMGKEELAKYQRKFPDTPYAGLKEKSELAEVYLFYYYGLSPIKHQIAVPIPLPNGLVTKLAFPTYHKRKEKAPPVVFKAVDQETDIERTAPSEETQDITAIAVQNLKSRRARVIAKALLRPGVKYALEKNIQDNMKEEWGDTSADVFGYVASLYNITSEQADLRSWQTLPAQIRVARLLLKPGRYALYAGERFLGTKQLQAGAKEYFIIRTRR